MNMVKKKTGPKVGSKFLTADQKDALRPQVVKLAQLGCTGPEIGHVVGLSEPAAYKNFAKEIAEGRANLKASLRKAQIESAILDKNPTMLIWMGKIYLDQREPKKELEHSGAVNIEKVVFKKEKTDG